jgi:hypothetical protein
MAACYGDVFPGFIVDLAFLRLVFITEHINRSEAVLVISALLLTALLMAALFFILMTQTEALSTLNSGLTTSTHSPFSLWIFAYVPEFALDC